MVKVMTSIVNCSKGEEMLIVRSKDFPVYLEMEDGSLLPVTMPIKAEKKRKKKRTRTSTILDRYIRAYLSGKWSSGAPYPKKKAWVKITELLKEFPPTELYLQHRDFLPPLPEEIME